MLPPGQDSPYRGNYASLPVVTLKPPSEGNRTVPVVILWQRDGVSPSYTIHFNARAQQVVSLSQIAALHIDNTQCSSTINIVFPDTQFQLQLGPNSEGFYPVVTNSLEFYAYIDLAPTINDRSVIQVLNFLPPPIEFGSAGGAGVGAGTVRQVDTVAPLQGGPITDQGTLSLTTPLALNIGGTGATTGNAALDTLSNTSGTTAGSLSRSAGGSWTVSAGAGSGTISAVNPGTGITGGGTSGAVTVGLQVPVTVANGGTGATTAPQALTNLGAAPIAAPVFTGDPRAPTPAPGDSDTSIATTAFVQAALVPLAPLASPTFTGSPVGPTAAPGTNTTQLATTAFATAGDTARVAKAGDTMTGALNVNLNAAPLPAATGPLHLGGADNGPAGAFLDAFGTTWPAIGLRRAKGTAAAPTAPVVNDILGSFEAFGYAGGAYQFGTGVYSVAKETFSTGSHGAFLQFNSTNGTVSEAALILGRGLVVGGFIGSDPGPGGIYATGNILTTTTLAGGYLSLTKTTAVSAEINLQNSVRQWSIGNIGTGDFLVFDNTAGTTRLQINTVGGCLNTTGTWSAFSDASLKTDIVDYTSGLAEITQLRPVSFGWKNKEFGAEKNWGLVAQEVEAVMPELVGEHNIAGADDEPNIVKTVDPGRAIFALINAVKELSAQVSALQAKVGT